MTTVLVTGASRGIGAAVAVRLAKSGHDLVLWARSADGLDRSRAAAEAAGVQVRTAVVDVSDPAQVERAAETLDGFGGLGGVVLNAGAGRWSPFDALTLEAWNATLGTNLHGAFHVLRAALPLLTARRDGLVVGMLSDSVLHPHRDRAAYTASKAGMSALLEVIRREVRSRNVRVSAVLPSRVDTHFAGNHPVAAPGCREGALGADDVAEVVATLFDLPAHVEIRHLQLAAMTSTYGPFPEKVT